MSNNQWTDLPDVFDGANVNLQSRRSFKEDEVNLNLQSGTPFRDDSEATTPSSSDSILRLNDSHMQEDDNHQVSEGNADKKKKTSRIIGWGLRRFSTIVCRKVQAKGRTTYNEVADEIIAELASGFDEKNIRRRVYDAFNVLIAIDVIAKDKKEIRWIGFPNTRTAAVKQLEEVNLNVMRRLHAKVNYLKELEQQVVDMQKLMLRNQQLQKSGNASEGVHVPFVLVQTHPKATVEIEISEDMRLVHFDFNETPYALHDHHAILKMMRCPQALKPEHASRSSAEDEFFITDKNGRPLKPPSFSWNSEKMNN